MKGLLKAIKMHFKGLSKAKIDFSRPEDEKPLRGLCKATKSLGAFNKRLGWGIVQTRLIAAIFGFLFLA